MSTTPDGRTRQADPVALVRHHAATRADDHAPAPTSPGPGPAPAPEDDRLAALAPQWRWAARRVIAYGWRAFPLNDRTKPKPAYHGDADDWSKKPRRRCASCKAATTGAGAKRPPECYAECGHRLCHGLLGASSDVEQVIVWAQRFPNANVGGRTGAESNLFVLDVDGEEGERRLAELAELHGPLPDTQRHQTGGGTWHYLFNYPTHRRNNARPDGEWRNSAKTKLGAGLDTRGEGGYIVLPGAVSRKGRYKAGPAAAQADPPDWMLDLLETVTRHEISPERRRELAANPRFDPATAPGGVHPYAAAAFTYRVAEFRALVGTGNGRTDLLAGGALYLSGLANATPPSGLTEEMVREAFSDACQVNGYADAHPDWAYQIDRGIEDGRSKVPRNWPPPELPARMAEVDRVIGEILASGDAERIARLTSALGGPHEIASWRALYSEGAARSPAADAPPTEVGGGEGLTSEASPVPTMGRDATDSVEVADPPGDNAAPARAAASDGTPPAGDVAPRPAGERPDKRIAVNVGGRDFSELRQEIQRALTLTNTADSWLYLHGERAVLVGRDGLQTCTQPLLVSRLADRLRFHRRKLMESLPVDAPAPPPGEVIGAIHADAQNLRLPEVDRVAHAPFFGPDGSLQREPGYHRAARTLYVPEPGVTIPDIPQAPTGAQVAAARSLLLDDLLVDFPFEKDPCAATGAPNAELAGALALAITPFVRSMIVGPTPLFALDAPDSRTGKGLLLIALLLPSWGRRFTVTPAPTRMEEWQKQIVASLRSAPVVAIFDNVNARIDSGALASRDRLAVVDLPPARVVGQRAPAGPPGVGVHRQQHHRVSGGRAAHRAHAAQRRGGPACAAQRVEAPEPAAVGERAPGRAGRGAAHAGAGVDRGGPPGPRRPARDGRVRGLGECRRLDPRLPQHRRAADQPGVADRRAGRRGLGVGRPDRVDDR